MNDISLRAAEIHDSSLVFAWRNDPFIILHGSSQRSVTAKEHEAWFKHSLKDDNRLLFVIEVMGEHAGLMRFDRVSELVAIISAYLIERFTGKGYGPRAIARGCLLLWRKWPVEKCLACVREDNTVGQLGFRKAGFRHENLAGLCPVHHVCLSLERNPSVSNNA